MGYLGTKPANSPLTSELIPDGLIGTSDIATNAVTSDKITANAVTEAKLASGLYTAKAWVNFNGTGTVAIRASGNVSSITDNGTGDYTVNFTNAMPDANYSAVSGAGDGAAAVGSGRFAFNYMQANPTSSAYRVITTNFAGSYHDPIYISVGIFR